MVGTIGAAGTCGKRKAGTDASGVSLLAAVRAYPAPPVARLLGDGGFRARAPCGCSKRK